MNNTARRTCAEILVVVVYCIVSVTTDGSQHSANVPTNRKIALATSCSRFLAMTLASSGWIRRCRVPCARIVLLNFRIIRNMRKYKQNMNNTRKQPIPVKRNKLYQRLFQNGINRELMTAAVSQIKKMKIFMARVVKIVSLPKGLSNTMYLSIVKNITVKHEASTERTINK